MPVNPIFEIERLTQALEQYWLSVFPSAAFKLSIHTDEANAMEYMRMYAHHPASLTSEEGVDLADYSEDHRYLILPLTKVEGSVIAPMPAALWDAFKHRDERKN